MRYALIKQDKIKEALGKKYLENNILQSLNKYFANSDAMLEFAVMGQMYDVLNLSYVGRMKG